MCAVAILFYFVLMLLANTQWTVVSLLLAAAVAMPIAGWLGLLRRVEQSFVHHQRLSGISAVSGVLALAVLFHGNSLVLFLLVTILINITVCLGLNIQLGYTGMVNFAGAPMLGIGAYTVALAGAVAWIPSWMLIPLGGTTAAVIGSLLLPPMLRTHGHYSAVITIAFALLFTTFLDSFQMVGGSQGLPVKSLDLFGWSFANAIVIGPIRFAFYANYLLLALFMTIAVAVAVKRLERSWIGLTLDAVRIDETASGCFGININAAKIFAFTVGNFIVGAAGALYGFVLGYIAPSNFTFGDSLTLITIILLGGIGSVWGIIITSAIVLILPERLQAIQEYRLLLYALLVLLVLRFFPGGLIPRGVRRYFPERRPL
jgi:ABC-type branched-subunit amino acid transport system permease subunit